MTAAGLWAFARSILTIAIPLPVWMLLAAGGWLWWDKTSTVRAEVDKAVTRLVAGAKLDALNAQLEAVRRIKDWSDAAAAAARKTADDERQARIELEQQLAISDARQKELSDELAAIEDRPAPADCRVDRQLLDGLRNR